MELKDIRDVLCASGKDIGVPGIDWYYGEGLLDIHALVVEDKGTITYDPLTDELKNETHIFVKGHTLQYDPEPERNYSVFDGWNYDINCAQEYDNYTDKLYEDITVYAAWANEDDTEPFSYYVKNDGTAEVTGYLGKRRYITIPDTLDGYTVTSIGTRAFSGNTRARKIVLPETLQSIGEYAFFNNTKLISIDIPKSVSEIKEYAFACCPRLGEVTFVTAGDLEKIGDCAFAQCGSLVQIDLPKNLSEINGSVFLCDNGVTRISVAQGNTTLSSDGKGLYQKKNGVKTISRKVPAGWDGWKVRCVVTDKYGTEVISEAASLTIATDIISTNTSKEEIIKNTDIEEVDLEVEEERGVVIDWTNINISNREEILSDQLVANSVIDVKIPIVTDKEIDRIQMIFYRYDEASNSWNECDMEYEFELTEENYYSQNIVIPIVFDTYDNPVILDGEYLLGSIILLDNQDVVYEKHAVQYMLEDDDKHLMISDEFSEMHNIFFGLTHIETISSEDEDVIIDNIAA